MSETELKQFDQLKADVALFVSPIKEIRVICAKDAQVAIEHAKEIRSYLNHLEDKRKDLVKPLNDQVKFINSYAKDIEALLRAAESHIKGHLVAYEQEQEKIRLEQLRKAEAERRERERQAELERQRIAAEAEAKRQAELAALAEQEAATTETGSFFGTEVDPNAQAEAERQAIEEDATRQRLEEEARLEREAKIREAEHKQKLWDIERQGVKNAKKIWKCELVDIEQVPKEFLVRTLNTQAVLAAARGGVTNIPGVRIWQETTVAIGRNTYVPKEALVES